MGHPLVQRLSPAGPPPPAPPGTDFFPHGPPPQRLRSAHAQARASSPAARAESRPALDAPIRRLRRASLGAFALSATLSAACTGSAPQVAVGALPQRLRQAAPDATLVLAPGTHTLPPGWITSSTVTIRGPGHLAGHAIVRGGHLSLERLAFQGAIQVEGGRLEVKSATLTHAPAPDAAHPALIDVRNGAVALQGVGLHAHPRSARLLRVRDGALHVQAVHFAGGKRSQLQLERSQGRIESCRFRNAGGSSVVVLANSALECGQLQIDAPQKMGLVVQSATVSGTGLRFRAPRYQAIGVAAGALSVRDVVVSDAQATVLAVHSFRGAPSRVRIEGAEITTRHAPSILIGAGSVTLTKARILGSGPATQGAQTKAPDPGPSAEPPPFAIVVRGPRSKLQADGLALIRTPGHGLVVEDEASLRLVDTEIRHAAGHGLTIRRTDQPVSLTRTRIAGGTRALWIDDAGPVTTTSLQIVGKGSEGIVTGADAEFSAEALRIEPGRSVGLAVHGASHVRLKRSRIAGTHWAIFQSCAAGQRLEAEALETTGRTARCGPPRAVP